MKVTFEDHLELRVNVHGLYLADEGGHEEYADIERVTFSTGEKEVDLPKEAWEDMENIFMDCLMNMGRNRANKVDGGDG